MSEIDETIAKIDAFCNRLIDTNSKLMRDLKDCRNELCVHCGRYKFQHTGSCDGCRWQKGVWNT